MGTYINIGNAGFQRARNSGYGDKCVNKYKELPFGKLPLGNILYLCSIKLLK